MFRNTESFKYLGYCEKYQLSNETSIEFQLFNQKFLYEFVWTGGKTPIFSVLATMLFLLITRHVHKAAKFCFLHL